MRRFCVSALILLALRLQAAHGIIDTVDGSRLEGDIRLDTGAFTVTAAEGTNRVELAKLARLRFQPPAATNIATNPVSATNSAPTNGLLGLYFNETDHTGPFKMRYDSTIDFDWGESAPFLGMNSDRFSVRWIGSVVPQTTEHYTFHTVTDDGVRLFINTNLVLEAWKEEFLNLASIPMVLYAGRRYDFRMEVFDNTARAMAKLYWSSPSIPRSIIPKACFFPGSPPDPATALAYLRVPAGIVLVDGSIVARRVQSADESSVKLNSASLPAFSTINIARLMFSSMTADSLGVLQPNRTGLLLQNKDFIEGEFRGLKDNRVRVYSVLFGVKTFDQAKVTVVVLRDIKPVPAPFEIGTRDESRLRAHQLLVTKDGLQLQGGLLSGMKVPAADLLEIKSAYKPGTQAMR